MNIDNITTNDQDLEKISSLEGLMNNPNISNYDVKSNKGSITKPNAPKNKQSDLYTPEDVIKFLANRKVPTRVSHDRLLLVELFEDQSADIFKANDSGIFLDSNENKTSIYGRMGERLVEEEHQWSKFYVFKAGNGMPGVPMEFKEGDIIEVGHFAGYPFSYKGVNYKIARDSDVLCQVPE